MKILIFLALLLIPTSAFAVPKVVRIATTDKAINVGRAVEYYSRNDNNFQISVVPGKDGIARQIEVSALRPGGGEKHWMVFALTNNSNEQLTRLLVTPHYRFVGSGIIWPDLGSGRISAITTSQGDPPEREDVPGSDAFRLTIDPGSTITYVVELKTPRLAQVYLWNEDAFKYKQENITLYHGIVIGICGLLALFMTIVFVVRGVLVFPASAALAWAVFAYICIDFGFAQRIFVLNEATERIWRATSEALIGATLIIFLFTYLNLRRWHTRFQHIALAWLLAMAIVIAISTYNPAVASGVARISIASVALVGLMLIFTLAVRGSERAILLIPTWGLLALWVLAAATATFAGITSDMVAPGLSGGLVLIVMLIGFTIMQSIFSGSGALQALGEDAERRALAFTGSGEAIFDWDVNADHIYVSAEIEACLGLRRKALEGPAAGWLDILHPQDRDRFSAALDGLLLHRAGKIHHDFRFRGADGQYVWILLKARPVIDASGEVVRILGSLEDVTETRVATERILHDAICDHLTGFPNRELFFDRLETMIVVTKRSPNTRLSVALFDIDQLAVVNATHGVSFGDSAILTIARRVARDLKAEDTLARLRGGQFGIILLREPDFDASAFAEALLKHIANMISFGDRELSVTASLGVCLFDEEQHPKASDLFGDAEIALRHAKAAGGGGFVLFKPAMRTMRDTRPSLGEDLRHALARKEIFVLFQPIVRLEDRTVVGFETSVRWRHPKLGILGANDLLQNAESALAGAEIWDFVLDYAARELAAWQKALDVNPPIFSVIPVPYHMKGPEMLQNLRSYLAHYALARGSLKLAVREALAIENPELTAQIVMRVRELGAGVMLDDFGAGYTSLDQIERYRFDTLKISASLSHVRGGAGRSRTLRSCIAMAHDLGMNVIAEHVDTESEAVELAQLGCEFAEGMVFGPPLTSAQARKIMGVDAE